jgi:hypothetical protein
MDQTTLTAHLPTIDVEITRRLLPEQNAEGITIHITATPSFDAAARLLMQGGLFPAMFPFASPFMFWANVMRACQPLLLPNAEVVRSLPEPD